MEVGHYHFEDLERDPVALLSKLGYRFWDAKSKQPYTRDAIRSRCSEPAMHGITINLIASPAEGFVP
jgi:hypothetical protein